MSRQAHTATETAAEGYPDPVSLVANSADIPLVAANASDKEECVWTKDTVIIAYNSGAGAHTVTVNSTADARTHRTGDITGYSVGAGEMALLGPFPATGWRQSDGTLHFEANNAEILFGVAKIARVN